MKLKIYPKSPAPRHIAQIIDVLKSGGLVILPTDGVYSIACAADRPKAIQKLSGLKGNAKFSFLFSNLSMVGDYTRLTNKDHYKMMNRLLPGPFTFILPASSKVIKMFDGRKTIGIRIPDNNIPLKVIDQLGIPLVATSVHDEDEIVGYTTDPDRIHDKWQDKIELIVDGGFGNNEATTVLECTDQGITMIRQGIGEVEEAMA